MTKTYSISLNGSLPEYLRMLDQANREVDRLLALLARDEVESAEAEKAFRAQDLYARIVGNLVLHRARDVGLLAVDGEIEQLDRQFLAEAQA